jgi:hypothetical protein
MHSRAKILDALLGFDHALPSLKTELESLAWDSEGPHATLTKPHATNVLTRYLSGELSTEELEEWANLIEGREDIGIEQSEAGLLEEFIFELANPILTQALSPESASQWLRRFQE